MFAKFTIPLIIIAALLLPYHVLGQGMYIEDTILEEQSAEPVPTHEVADSMEENVVMDSTVHTDDNSAFRRALHWSKDVAVLFYEAAAGFLRMLSI